MKHICPVCGFDELDEAPYDGYLGSEDICESCGFQFETLLEDEKDGHLFDEWRTRWIDGGMEWQSNGVEQPANWDPKEKLRNIGIDK